MRTIVLTVTVALLASACTTGGDATTDQRLAQVEHRVAQLEAAVGGTGGPDVAAAGQVAEDAPSQKEAFARAVAEDRLATLLADAEGVGEVTDLRFDAATDTLVVQTTAEGDDGDAAWQAAQQLADLWDDLTAYQPVLDLKVGEVRCACSATLMKGVAAGSADRTVWESACQRPA